MNILFIHYLPIAPYSGGVERVTFLLAQEFERRVNKIQFLSLNDKNKEEAASTQTKFTQEYLPIFGLEKEEFRNKFEELLKDFETDLIIVQGTNIEEKEVLKYIPAGIEVITVLHNQPLALLGKERVVKKNTPLSSLKLKGKLLTLLGRLIPSVFSKLYVKQAISNLDAVIQASSKFMLLSSRFNDRLLQFDPGNWGKKVTAINNPLTFSLSDSSIDAEDKENIVLVVCRLSNPQKNLTGFIDVWKRFSKRHSDWRAIVVGDGEDKDFIMHYARKKGVENLSFEGQRPDVQNYYRKAKIFCMTSAYEGWGMVLTEAMAFGCVPVAYDTFEAVHDIIDDGKNGLIVPPFDERGMVKALERIANDEPLRAEMAENARKKVKDFTVEAIADQWEELVFKPLRENK